MQQSCVIENFPSYDETIICLLEVVGAPEILAQQARILIKRLLAGFDPVAVDAADSLSPTDSWHSTGGDQVPQNV
ncbi:MAG: hypothetical protein PHD01_00940 [Geobacteraceae bacterium]|nr:hypothetical protein [Geobacteraceae bacterium]